MTETFPDRGIALLQKAWSIALEAEGEHHLHRSLAASADRVFAGSEAGYHKAIVIQAAGKAADPSLDAQAMQKGGSSDRSWDAREFAKKVFVPWNIAVGSPFSHSADPYVSNPYRIPRFDRSIRSQRKKPAEFDAALEVLEEIESTDQAQIAFEHLIEILFSLRRFIADRTVDYPIPNRASLSDVISCLLEFTAQRSGGARLQAVVYALFQALELRGMAYTDIMSGHVNAADARSKSPGDVAFRLSDSKFAVEIKDRPLDRAELEATVEKCRVAQVGELLFVIRSPSTFAHDLDQEQFAAQCGRQFSSGLNIYIEPFFSFAQTVLTLIGEQGRRDFLVAVGAALAEQNADIKHKWAWADLVKNI